MRSLCRRNALVLMTLLLFGVALPGCWDRRELGDLAIVAGAGVDAAPKGQYEVTVQIIKPELVRGGQPQSGGGGGTEPAVWFGHDKGSTIFEAVRGFVKRTSRRLYLPHNQILVIGKETARKGIRPVLDFFVRDHESRQTVWMLIAEGSARDVIEVKSKIEKIPALAISKRIESSDEMCRSRAVKLQELIELLMSKSTSPVVPLARISRQEQNVEVLVEGMAVFRGDRLAGTLDPRQTRGLMWVQGEVKSAVMPVATPIESEKATVEIIRPSSKVTASLKGQKASFRIDVRATGNLGCEMSTADLTKTTVWKSLESRAAAAIRNEIASSLEVTKRLKTDVYGFGEALHRKYPRQWKHIKERWPDLFAQANVVISVTVTLRQSGMITKTPVPKP